MLFISGTRQVGKTTAIQQAEPSGCYLDWDVQEGRTDIIQGQRHLTTRLGSQPNQAVLFDELHKYNHWKNFVKGFYDLYSPLHWKIIVTGSVRLDTFRKGVDSLLGRYFHLQMFPLSVAELVQPAFRQNKPAHLNKNFIACALLKAVEGWNDTGLGDFSLHFIRTKEKREVDFLVTKDGSPWFLTEVKTSEAALSPELNCFQKMIGATHAFQVVVNLPYEDINYFSLNTPAVVPARTLLSQLL